MSLQDKQFIFTFNISKLIQFAYGKGFTCSFGEAWRPDELQKIYFDTKRSKTLINKHGSRVAVDFNIFYQGRMLFRKGQTREEYLVDLELVRPLGEYWESLHTDNVWGGDWNRNNIADEKLDDPYHFEMKF